MSSLSLFSGRGLSLLALALLAGCGAEAPVESAAPVVSAAEAEAATRALLETLDPREQAFTARFDLRVDGTAVDSTTGLMWMRCAIGQMWQGRGCGGEPRQLSWGQANDLVQGFAFAGHADWRLPTRDELLSLVYCSSGLRRAPDADGVPGSCEGGFRAPTVLVAAFPNTPAHKFWSGTQDERYRFAAWGVSFTNGATGVGTQTDYVHVRLVRRAFEPAPAQDAGAKP